MADRAYMAITVFECPEDRRAQLLTTILEVLGESAYDNETLQLGDRYSVDEIVLGADEELFDAIAEHVGLDGLTFDLQQEPKYEFDGSRRIAVAGLGATSFDCNSDGEPIVRWDQVKDLVGDAEALAKAFKRPWIEGLQQRRTVTT